MYLVTDIYNVFIVYYVLLIPCSCCSASELYYGYQHANITLLLLCAKQLHIKLQYHCFSWELYLYTQIHNKALILWDHIQPHLLE